MPPPISPKDQKLFFKEFVFLFFVEQSPTWTRNEFIIISSIMSRLCLNIIHQYVRMMLLALLIFCQIEPSTGSKKKLYIYAILSMQKKLRVLTIRTLVVSRVLANEFVYRRIDLKMWLLYVGYYSIPHFWFYSSVNKFIR